MLDSNMTDIPEEDDVSKWDYDEAKLKPLDEETYKTLVTFAAAKHANGWTPRKDALLHAQSRIWASSISVPPQGKRTV